MVEVLLSTDNICLFHQIFEHFKVPREVRPGLLFVGTPFMVLTRGGERGRCTHVRAYSFARRLVLVKRRLTAGVYAWTTRRRHWLRRDGTDE